MIKNYLGWFGPVNYRFTASDLRVFARWKAPIFLYSLITEFFCLREFKLQSRPKGFWAPPLFHVILYKICS